MIMGEFILYQLDDYHAIGQFMEKNGNLSWQMVVTIPPICNRIIDGGAGFEFYEIDPDDFEWNGRRVRMVVEK